MTRHKHVITTRVFCLTLVVAATTAGTAFALPADNGGADYFFTQWDYFTDINDAGNPGGPGTSLWYTEDIDGTAGPDWVDSSTGPWTTNTGLLSNSAQGLKFFSDTSVTSGGTAGGTAWPNAESTGVGMTIANGYMWQSKAWVGGAGDTLSFYHSPADSDRSFELLISDKGQAVTGIGAIGSAWPYDNTSPTSELEEPFWQVNYTPGEGYHVWRNYELLTNTGPIVNSKLPSRTGENEMTISLAEGTRADVDFFAFENQSFLPDHSYGRFGYPAGTECSAVSECITTTVPQPSGSLWEMGTPITSYGHGPGANFGDVTPAKALELDTNGFNMVWAQQTSEIDNAHAQGLRAMYWAGGYTDDPTGLDDPFRLEGLNINIDSVKNRPGMYAYYMADEPTATEFEDLGRLAAHIRERDPNHMIYINLFPTGASDVALLGPGAGPGSTTQAYREYLRQFVEHVKPDVISYDHYHFRDGHDGTEYFLNLALVREAALNADIPFINYVQAVSLAPTGWRVPTPEEGKWLAYTTLAYGGQGLMQFTYYGYSEFSGGVYDPYPPGSAITPLGEALRDEINPEFVAVAEQLQPLTSIGAFHVGTQPLGTELLPDDSPFDVLSPSQDLLLGLFGGPNAQVDEATYALVVNTDYGNSKNAHVTGPGDWSVFDASTGVWSPMGNGTVLLNLPPGGGSLVRFFPSTGFTWDLSGLGDWNDPASWQPGGGPPNSAEHTATFASAISAPSTVVVDTPVTVNRIEFNSANSYAVAGLGSVDLAFDPDDPNDPNDAFGNPTIEVFAGNHQFQADVNLTANTDVTAGDNTTLEFHNTIDLGSNDLTIAPALGGAENGIVVLNTSITGSGNVSNSATLSAGLSASLGGGDFDSTGTLDFDITPDSAGQLFVGGTATLDGEVNVDFLDGAIPAASTTLLTAGSPIVLPGGLPTLSFSGASGLSLALSGDSMSLLLNSVSNPVDANGNGFIDGADFLILQRTNPSLIAQWQLEYGNPAAAAASGDVSRVPEPSTMLLLALGATALAYVRRSRGHVS